MSHLGLSRLREKLVGGYKDISLPHWVIILTLHIVIVITIIITIHFLDECCSLKI